MNSAPVCRRERLRHPLRLVVVAAVRRAGRRRRRRMASSLVCGASAGVKHDERQSKVCAAAASARAVIAGRRGHEPRRTRRRPLEPRDDGVERAARLEGVGELQRLELERDAARPPVSGQPGRVARAASVGRTARSAAAREARRSCTGVSSISASGLPRQNVGELLHERRSRQHLADAGLPRGVDHVGLHVRRVADRRDRRRAPGPASSPATMPSGSMRALLRSKITSVGGFLRIVVDRAVDRAREPDGRRRADWRRS